MAIKARQIDRLTLKSYRASANLTNAAHTLIYTVLLGFHHCITRETNKT